MSRFQHSGLCLVSALAILVPACVTEDARSVSPDPGVGDPAAPPHVVTRITTDERAQLTFYNERAAGDDPVISVEISSPESTPVIDALLAQQPSALELFAALQPNRAAPDELVREHRLLAAVDAGYAATPRALIAASAVGSNVVEPFSCAGNFLGWQAAFLAWTPALDSETTGAIAGASSLNVDYSPKFYFDVCRTTNSGFAYVVRTDRRSSPSGAWNVFDDGSPLALNQRYRFFRNTFTCSSFQYRLFVDPVGGSYFRGAAWDDAWSCTITL